MQITFSQINEILDFFSSIQCHKFGSFPFGTFHVNVDEL